MLEALFAAANNRFPVAILFSLSSFLYFLSSLFMLLVLKIFPSRGHFFQVTPGLRLS